MTRLCSIMIVCMILLFPKHSLTQTVANDIDSTSVAIDTLLDSTKTNETSDSTSISGYMSYRSGFYGSKNIYIGSAFTAIYGIGVISDVISLEHHINPLSFVYFTERKPSFRLAATPIVMMGVFAIPWSFGKLISLSGESTIKYILPVFLIPFGLHMQIQPDPRFSLYSGYSIDYLLSTNDDGALFQFNIGVRYRPNYSRLGFNLEGTKTRFWGWEKESSTSGWGVGLYLSYDVFNSSTNKEFGGYPAHER